MMMSFKTIWISKETHSCFKPALEAIEIGASANLVSEKCRPMVPRLGGEDANLWSSRTADGVETVIKSLLMPGTIVGLLKTVAAPTVIVRGLRGSGPAPPRPTLLPPLHRREPRPDEAFPARGTELPVLEDMRLVMLRITRWVRWCMSEARGQA